MNLPLIIGEMSLLQLFLMERIAQLARFQSNPVQNMCQPMTKKHEQNMKPKRGYVLYE